MDNGGDLIRDAMQMKHKHAA